MLKQNRRSAVICSFIAGLFSSTAIATPARAQSEPTEPEEVVVTAERRETTVQRTPLAVTALDGKALARRGQTDLNDLASNVPNVFFTSNVGASQIFIRGIGNSLIVPGSDPGVAFYSDGAYVSDQWATNVAFFDVARIEVLRGPQGSLYGRNATGGAVNVISAPPTATFEGGGSALLGNFGQTQADGFISGPLSGGILARLSVQIRSNSGFTANQLRGVPNAPDRVDDLSTQALRLQISAPTDAGGGNLKLIASYFHGDDAGPTEKTLYEPGLPAELLYGATPSRDARALKSQVSTFNRKVTAVTAQYDKPLGGSVLTVIGSYRRSKLTHLYDQDGTEASQALTGLKTNGKEFNVDARIASDRSRRFNWIAGVTYVDFNQERAQTFEGQIPLGFVAPGLPLNIPFALDFSTGGEVKTTSGAAYFDARYQLTEQLSLTAGARYTVDKKRAGEFQIFNGAGVTKDSDKRWSSPSGKIGINYQATDDALLYASVARGFKSGAIAVGGFTDPAKPEIVTNAEVGAKVTFWEKRGQLNVAAFINNYDDLQVFAVGELTAILSNAAKARIGGLEIEGRLRPIKGLTLDGSLGYNDATYREFSSPDLRRRLPLVDVSGNQLPLVSKVQYRLGAEYAFPAGSRYRGTIRTDYAWRSKYFFTEFNTSDAMQPGYGTLDISATFAPATARWRIYGYVRNLTNETTINAMTINSPLLGSSRLVNLNPPRRFGIGVGFDF